MNIQRNSLLADITNIENTTIEIESDYLQIVQYINAEHTNYYELDSIVYVSLDIWF
jgi:hypothetical protein